MLTLACKIVVKQEVEKIGLVCTSVELGKVEIFGLVTSEQLADLKTGFSNAGFELLKNKRSILIERIKNVVVEMVYFSQSLVRVNFSSYLSEKLNLHYTYLANVFSRTEGITIEQFTIRHKIERVKQLIRYNEMSLTQIAWMLNYSSVAHLSTQFKRLTGITPSHFRQIISPSAIPQNM